MYLFEDINFSTQDEEEKEETGKRFETLLRSMNVSYKIIVSNHYADNGKLRGGDPAEGSEQRTGAFGKGIPPNDRRTSAGRTGEDFYNPSISLSVAESRIMKVPEIILIP